MRAAGFAGGIGPKWEGADVSTARGLPSTLSELNSGWLVTVSPESSHLQLRYCNRTTLTSCNGACGIFFFVLTASHCRRIGRDFEP